MMKQAPDTIRIKFMAKKLRPDQVALWRRQLPGGSARVGCCEFSFDQDDRDYDWLVVYDDLSPLSGEKFSARREILACPPENTVLVTAEPSSIKCYSSDFCAQFGLVITHHQPWAIRHRNLKYSQTSYPWFYGRGEQRLLSYDEIHAHPPLDKNQLISTICSARLNPATLQGARIEFTEKLQEAIPEMVRFGKGVRELDDKAEVLDGFRYHVTIENDVARHYFTEKLVDAFLGLSLPFYYGCPNAADYFPADSFIPIDIFDFEGSLRTIEQAIAEDAYEQRLEALKEARRRVLEEYNIFAMLAKEIESRQDGPISRPAGQSVIMSRRALRNSGPLHFLRAIWEKQQLKREVARRRAGQPVLKETENTS